MQERGWTRRAALGTLGAAIGGVGGALAGCSWFEAEPEPPPPDPLEPLLQGTRELIASYAEVLVAHPELAELRPLHEAHLAHEQVLLALIGRPELASPAGGAGRWVPPASATPVTGSAAEAVAGLREAETGGLDAAWQACLAAPPERAAVLGSITAARATHLVVLA